MINAFKISNFKNNIAFLIDSHQKLIHQNYCVSSAKKDINCDIIFFLKTNLSKNQLPLKRSSK